MYSHTSVSVQLGNKLSPFFTSKIGVRQGDNLSPTLFNIYVNEIPKLFDQSCSPATFGEMKLSALLYADDLVLFSETNEGIQRAVDRLGEFCSKWCLNINTHKSKFICINKSHCKSSPSLHLGGFPLSFVSSYKYLGLEVSDDGKTEIMMKDLYQRALKVFFKLTRSLQPLPNPKILFHLFDGMIKPVLLYGCEIWMPTSLLVRESLKQKSANAQFFYDLKLDFPIEHRFLERANLIEKLHLKFCRFVLGVHQKTANLAVYGETGRYPLYIDQIVQCVKYYHHLENTENTLLKSFYYNLINKEKDCMGNSLVGFCKSIHTVGGVTIPKSSSKYLNPELKKTLQYNFKNYWFRVINNDLAKKGRGGNKLRTYKQFKGHFKAEAYLSLHDFKLRRAMARLRTSAHRLRIESDRYNSKNQYTPPEKRICTNCLLGEPEDEPHFLIKCTAFTRQRDILFATVTSVNPHFSSYNAEQRFLWLMSTEDMKVLPHVANYIECCMDIRH